MIDYMAYMDYMDLAVCCLRKAVKNHSLTILNIMRFCKNILLSTVPADGLLLDARLPAGRVITNPRGPIQYKDDILPV